MNENDDLVALIDRLARFFFLAKRYGEAVHAEDGLTTGERAILYELLEIGPRSVPQMADLRGISRQAIQRTVDGLFDRGLVTKIVPKSDRRNRLIELTKKGQSLIGKMKQREKEEQSYARGKIAPSDLSAVNSTLDRIESLIAVRTRELEASK